MSYAPNRSVFVDVDGTLSANGAPNLALIEWLRGKKAEGFFLALWSARGRDHAERAAIAFGCLDLFDVILSKPGYIVDDMGPGWTRYIKTLHPAEIAPTEAN